MDSKEKLKIEKQLKITKVLLIIISLMISFLIGINYDINDKPPVGSYVGGRWEINDRLLKNPENYIKIRVDNLMLSHNITEIVNHEIGHEIYWRLINQGIVPMDMGSEEFAQYCEVNLNECVEILNDRE